MQPNIYSLSLYASMNLHGGSGQLPQQSRSAGLAGGYNPSSQISHTSGELSKTSFSVFNQTTANGHSSMFCAQQTASNLAPATNPQSHCQVRNDNSDCQTSPARGNSFADYSYASVQTSSGNDCGCKDSSSTTQSQWSSTAVSKNKTSIDLGDYKLDFSKSNSSMTVTNKATGDKTEVWADPHLTLHKDGANSSTAKFNGNMTFELPDNTRITVGTQAGAKDKSVSYADQVTITRGDQAYQVTGLSQQDKAGLSVQKSNDGRALATATPDGYILEAARNGSGWIDPTTGKEPTANDVANRLAHANT